MLIKCDQSWWSVCVRRANILELSDIQQAVKKDRLVRSVHTKWQSHAVPVNAKHTDSRTNCTSCLLFLSLSLSLASCSALGKIVSSLVMITMRVSGLWGQKDITRARPHWKRSCLDSTRPGISGQVRNIKTMAYPVLHWPTGQKSKDTKRGHSSFWGLTVGWGCTVGPRGLLNIMQLTGQQSITANI